MTLPDRITILTGDCRETLKTLPDASVQCCVTSPPYWCQRDYGHTEQLGREATPDAFVATLVAVFAEVRRVLRSDGSLWLVLGDTLSGSGKGGNPPESPHKKQRTNGGSIGQSARNQAQTRGPGENRIAHGLKAKDLIGIPWRVALALQEAGWYLRSDIIWAKPNCMPESVTDRPTRSHEYIFLLTKSARYFYDVDAIKEPCVYDVNGTGTAARKARATEDQKSHPTAERNGIRAGGYKNSVNFEGKNKGAEKQRGHSRRHAGFNDRWDRMEREEQCTGMRNKRDVWTVAPATYDGAHFATFPPALIQPCILAGSRVGDTILDPFFGSGTTGEVALSLGRKCIGCELNPEYVALAEQRISQVTPGLAL